MMVLFFFSLWVISMFVIGIRRTKFDLSSKKDAIKNRQEKYLDSNGQYRMVKNDHPITEYLKNNEWFIKDNITGDTINITKIRREANNKLLRNKAIERGDDLYLVRFPCDHNGYPNGKDYNIYGEHIITEQSPWYKSIKDDEEYIPRLITDNKKITTQKVFLIRVSDGKFIRPVVINEDEEDINEINEWINELNKMQNEYHMNHKIKYTWGKKYTTINYDDSLEDSVMDFERRRRAVDKCLREINP